MVRWNTTVSRKWKSIMPTIYLNYNTFFYNSANSCTYVLETLFTPAVRSFIAITRSLGWVFIVSVVALIGSVVLIFYTCLLPTKLEQSLFWTVYHLIFGHWLLTMICFNYFRAAFSDPGRLLVFDADDRHPVVPEMVGICARCLSPKPPRAHHCNICNCCVLQMDHHCPWLDNCIGQNNHRYFFMFIIYLMVGSVYAYISAIPVYREHYGGLPADSGLLEVFVPPLMFYRTQMVRAADPAKFARFPAHGNLSAASVGGAGARQWDSARPAHSALLYMMSLCWAVFLAMLLMAVWHGFLISTGQTSIEYHVNTAQRRKYLRQGLTYHNPYNHRIWDNWRMFLGLTSWWLVFRRILLPSTHRSIQPPLLLCADQYTSSLSADPLSHIL